MKSTRMGLAMVAEALLPVGAADGEEAVAAEPDAPGAVVVGAEGEPALVVAEPEGPGGAPLYRVAPLGIGLT